MVGVLTGEMAQCFRPIPDFTCRKHQMAKFYSKTQLILREVWRTAHTKGRVEIVLPSAAKAHKLRFDLYAAVREEKMNNSDDFQLTEAAATLEIVLGEDKRTLIMQKKADNEVFKAIAAATGLDVTSVVDPFAEAQANEALKRLGIVQAEAKPDDKPQLGEHQSTPFYPKR